MNPVLKVRDVCLSYHTLSGETPALSHISFDLMPGEFLSIVGPSGCGKSTLLNLIAGLLTPEHGSITLGDRPVSSGSAAVGYMLQKDHLLEWRSIYKNILLGLEIRKELTPEKLPLSSAADFAAIYKGRCGCFRQYSDCGGVSCPPLFPSTDRNGKCQTLIWIFHHYYGRQAHFGQTSPSLTTTRERGVLPKMGAKNATDFQKSVALLFGAVFNFSLPFPLLGKRKGQPILAVL